MFGRKSKKPDKPASGPKLEKYNSGFGLPAVAWLLLIIPALMIIAMIVVKWLDR